MLLYTCKASRYCYITWNLKHSEFVQTKTTKKVRQMICSVLDYCTEKKGHAVKLIMWELAACFCSITVDRTAVA